MSFVTHLFGRSGRPRSIIAVGTTLRGTIEGAEELVVCGTVLGDIGAKAVTIEAGGRVDGDIRADVLLVSGTVRGTCTTAALAVAASGSLHGDATYERLEVAPGALVEARCHTRAPQAAPAARPGAEKAVRPTLQPALRTA